MNETKFILQVVITVQIFDSNAGAIQPQSSAFYYSRFHELLAIIQNPTHFLEIILSS